MNITNEGPADYIYSSKYTKIYNTLIKKRQIEVLQKTKELYTEVHHILPRSLGGTDDNINLVRLTAREHFVAHLLLARMFKPKTNPWYKMHCAICRMKDDPTKKCIRYVNSRLYAASKLVSMEYTLIKALERKKNLMLEFMPLYEEWRISGEKIFTWYEKKKNKITHSMKTVFNYINELEASRDDKLIFNNLRSRERSEEELEITSNKLSTIMKIKYQEDPTLRIRIGENTSKHQRGVKKKEEHKSKISEGLYQYNRENFWIKNLATKECKIFDINLPLPDGWIKGKFLIKKKGRGSVNLK